MKAGDSWVFPNGWKGTAEVVEKVRKVYLMITDGIGNLTGDI